MATGNLFLGTGRRKIGDVVLYRRNGVQQARVRVRTIANPKTEGQALQRNFLAPVNKFYAPLAGVLERSWEGLNKEASHNAFQKANIELARTKGWYLPKGAGFTPLPYKVSKGIMSPLEYNFNNTSGKFVWNILGISSGDGHLKINYISARLVDLGYQYGDQVTTILFIHDDINNELRPAWFRFLLSESNEDTIGSLIPFELDVMIGTGKIEFSGDVGAQVVGGAIIASRWDGSKWLRSTQYCAVADSVMDNITSIAARAAAIASYQSNAGVVSSDVYLNGGNGSQPAGAWNGVLNLYNKTTGNFAAIVKVESVRTGLASSVPVEVYITNQSTGITSVANVRKGGTGADKGQLLLGDGTFAAADATGGGLLDATEGGDQFETWLANNGITIEP